MSNIKNTWKGIKSIKTIKNLLSDIPKMFFFQLFDHLKRNRNFKFFNNYFTTIAEKTKENINPSKYQY